MAGVIGLRGPDIDKRDALRGYKVEWKDADRPIIRPHTGCPVLTLEGGKPTVARHVFGFSREFTSFNARSDKLEEGKMWSRMFGKAHGVAPVSYILEWADLGDGKRPYRIERADGAAMAVPALVGPYWENREERAFALVTVEPNEFVSRIHNRVIAQLEDDRIRAWLAPGEHTKEELKACLTPGNNEDFVAYPLKADAGSAKFDDAAALSEVGKPVTWDDVRRKPEAGSRRPDGEAGGAKKEKGGRQATL
ncbi:MAG: SOS response-associated peptidase family protein [Methanobacteriota archaeon]